ncbi:MAG: 3-deoxy-8-phosphooctulonate synthase [Candidatus Omnitrophota bacterium]
MELDLKKIIKKEFFLIAGPCVIESEKLCLEQAKLIREIAKRVNIHFIFKASFDKANRTAVDSFRGPGLKKGLSILKKIKQTLKIPILTDVHSLDQVRACASVVDIIQIPALLSRQTDLIVGAARTKKIINIKKGQFMAPSDMQNVIKKAESAGNKNIILTERGVCFGYHNLVSDMRSIQIMQKFNYPVVYDATHSVQLPSAGGEKSAGESQFVIPLALAAVAAGCNGLFLEVHKNPKKALCDGPNMIAIKDLEKLLGKAKKIWETVNEKK